MNATVYDISRARRRTPAPRLQLPESLLAVSEIFGFPLPQTFTAFYLRRTKAGTQVFIKSGRLTLNLSSIAKTHPTTFKEARKWVAAVADRYGWQIIETRQRR